MHLLYLHGFTSSARSAKAAFFGARAAGHGVQLLTVDFNEPDFAGLTVTRMLGQVAEVIHRLAPDPVALIGSSLGGLVAVHAAAAHPDRVDRIVLLAPALEFSGDRLEDLGDRSVDKWRRTGTLQVFHYGYGRLMPVGFGLYEDAAAYDAGSVHLTAAVQIFQGRRDVAVSPAAVQRWAAARPGTELHLLDDDHQLMSSLDGIWREMERFLWTEREAGD